MEKLRHRRRHRQAAVTTKPPKIGKRDNTPKVGMDDVLDAPTDDDCFEDDGAPVNRFVGERVRRHTTYYKSNLETPVKNLQSLEFSPNHIKELKRTPLWMLFNAIWSGDKVTLPKRCRKNEADIRKVLSCYDEGEDMFVVGGERLEITSTDVHLIFGVCGGAEPIPITQNNYEITSWVRRCFPEKFDPENPKYCCYKGHIYNKLQSMLGKKGKEHYEDVARLVHCYLLASFLIPCNNGSINWHITCYVEKIEEMYRYDWPGLVLASLMNQIKRGKTMKVSGCTVILPYWLLEHMSLLRPDNESALPRFLKRNLPLLHKKLDNIDPYLMDRKYVHKLSLYPTSSEKENLQKWKAKWDAEYKRMKEAEARRETAREGDGTVQVVDTQNAQSDDEVFATVDLSPLENGTPKTRMVYSRRCKGSDIDPTDCNYSPDLPTADYTEPQINESSEEIQPETQRLVCAGRQLDGNRTLVENHIGMESSCAGNTENPEGPQSAPVQLNATSQGQYELRKRPTPQIAPEQNKRARPATQTAPNSNSHSDKTYKAKLDLFALYQEKAAAILSDLMPKFRACPPSMLSQLEDLKRETATARSKEKELEAIISELRHENTELSSRCASLVAEDKKTKEKLTVFCTKEKELEAINSELRHENTELSSRCASLVAEDKKTKEELTVCRTKEIELEASNSKLRQENKKFSAQCAAFEAEYKRIIQELTVASSKEKELEATNSRLKNENETLAARCASYKSQAVTMDAEHKKTSRELMVSRSKEEEQDATISRLTHKNQILSAECSSYESQIVALEAEYKKTKEELENCDKKLYSGARAAGYAEGLKEGKLKSAEFINRLTDASVKYFDYGFESCQKQAEQQGFVGKLNKNSALKEALNSKDQRSNTLM